MRSETNENRIMRNEIVTSVEYVFELASTLLPKLMFMSSEIIMLNRSFITLLKIYILKPFYFLLSN